MVVDDLLLLVDDLVFDDFDDLMIVFVVDGDFVLGMLDIEIENC